VAETSAHAARARATRARITEAALRLFADQGMTDTTIDQIAEAAGVSRRSIFHHFPTKEAILFDHLVLPRAEVVERLRERPADEPALVSLHAVLRELCDHGFDRELLDRIRTVIAREPRTATPAMSLGLNAFELNVIGVLEMRMGRGSALQARALTYMALGWVAAAAHVYLSTGKGSLVGCFDDAVDACLGATADELRMVAHARR
jgi:AcrR family transcriptional regulator